MIKFKIASIFVSKFSLTLIQKNMKKFFKIFAVVFATSFAASNADAQFYLSGNFSMKNVGGETKVSSVSVDKDPQNIFHIGAEAGYYFSDNMAVGADIAFEVSKTKDAAKKDNWDASNMFYFDPYFRYDFVSTEKISFGLKAEVVLGFGKESYKANGKKETDSKITELGFSILPVLNYKFNSNWSAGVSFGVLSYRNNKVKDQQGAKDENITNTWNAKVRLQSLNFSVVYTF